MIKIFKMDGGCFNRKVNFVDTNNRFVGYDIDPNCCEQFGYFISDKSDIKDIDTTIGEQEIDEKELVGYVFDPKYMVDGANEDTYEQTRFVCFKLIPHYSDDSNPPKYLYLYNCHNGYYSHGFEFGELVAKTSGNL